MLSWRNRCERAAGNGRALRPPGSFKSRARADAPEDGFESPPHRHPFDSVAIALRTSASALRRAARLPTSARQYSRCRALSWHAELAPGAGIDSRQ